MKVFPRNPLPVIREGDEAAGIETGPPHSSLGHGELCAGIITRNKRMRAIFQYLEAVASSGEPVLVCGETGVGKELIVNALHRLSRCQGELVALNVAGLDDAMFSDALFGHRRGAYTGADSPREGLIARARDGTLFLDEIGDLSHASQIKLLRLVQERKFYPLGADVALTSNARVVVATNQDLNRLIAAERFRLDLYYRLAAHRVDIPPLRERRDDLPLLIDFFIDEACRAMGKKVMRPPVELVPLLANHLFPGNIRELRSMVHDAVVQHREGAVLSLDSFRRACRGCPEPKESDGDEAESPPVHLRSRFPTLTEVEAYLIHEALRRANGNQGIAAGWLGISRQALNKRLNRRKSAMGEGP